MPRITPELFEGRAHLPYALRKDRGEQRLIVSFPKMKRGVTPPSREILRTLEGVPGHHLIIGSDEHSFVGPKGTLAGIETAVELVRTQADRLEIAPEDVVLLGTSGAGFWSLMVGMILGGGRILAGAPPLRPGTQLATLADAPQSQPDKLAAAWFLGLAPGTREDQIRFYDEMVFRVAPRCPRATEISLYTSPGDYAWPSIEEFFNEATALPQLRVEIILDHFPKHGAVGPGFWEFARRALEPEDAPTRARARPADSQRGAVAARPASGRP